MSVTYAFSSSEELSFAVLDAVSFYPYEIICF